MRNSAKLFIGAFVLSVLGGAASADASISGIVTVPGQACQATPGYYWFCPFTSIQPSYSAPNVNSIYADFYASSGHFWAAACEQSYTGSSLHCTGYTGTTATGYQDFYFPGFSTITGATGSAWDYYFTIMNDVTSITLYGNGFN